MNTGIRAGSDFIISILVGGAVGYFLDDFFGTAPFLLILFLLAGMGAGFRNVYYIMQESDKKHASDGLQSQEKEGTNAPKQDANATKEDS